MTIRSQDAHKTKKDILIERGIIKSDPFENMRYQEELPRGFSLNLCGHCNYRCTCCPQGNNPQPREFIKAHIVENLFDELGNRAVYVQMGARGENLLHPRFFDFVSLMKSKNSLTFICLNTNGSLVTEPIAEKLLEAGVDQIQFSLQTINAEVYQQLTGSTHHRRIINHIVTLAELKAARNSPVMLTVQYLDFPENAPYRHEFIAFFKSYNISIHFQDMHSWGETFASSPLHDPHRYPCPYLFLYPTISHQGYLNPCFIDFYGELSYGSLETHSLRALWHSDAAEALRDKHLRGEWDDVPMCRNCTGYKLIPNAFGNADTHFYHERAAVGSEWRIYDEQRS